MKKLFIAGLLFLNAQFSFGVDIIVRHNRGLFGYERVDVTQGSNSGDRQLNCTDPGRKKCNWPSSIAESDNYNDILNTVDSRIENSGQFSGSFQQSGYYVTYDFNLKEDYLVVKIYTQEEAIANGFLD